LDGKTYRSYMENPALIAHAQVLNTELAWLRDFILARINFHFGHDKSFAPPDLPTYESVKNSPYAHFVTEYKLPLPERLLLAIALAPHVIPAVLRPLLLKDSNTGDRYMEFGGIVNNTYHSINPTIQTVYFLLGGSDIKNHLQLSYLFDAKHYFYVQQILELDTPKDIRSKLYTSIQMREEALLYFTTGAPFRPSYSSSFPANRLTTTLRWEDLVLHPQTLSEVKEISAWIAHQHTIMQEWQLGRVLKKGYRALFYGAPGTGKTLTATLLGQQHQMEVYRVDLSQLVSKYIGETEKNLARVFDMAEGRNWILFFDEADALFGERSSSSSPNAHFANQQIAYLLQKIEDFPGIILLATNLRGNIDEAFGRRFQAMIKFTIPDEQQRLLLWQKALADLPLATEINLATIAEKYEVSGGSIINVIRYVAIQLAQRANNEKITLYDLQEGIRREIRKTGSRF